MYGQMEHIKLLFWILVSLIVIDIGVVLFNLRCLDPYTVSLLSGLAIGLTAYLVRMVRTDTYRKTVPIETNKPEDNGD